MADIPAANPIVPIDKKARPGELDDLLRHLQTPVNVALNISFHAAGDPVVAGRSPAGTEDRLASMLPAESMARLRGLEPKVMQWLAANDANRLLFLSDPVAALQQIDKTLDKSFMKQLQRARRRLASDQPVDSRIRLSQVRVAVVQKPASGTSPTAPVETTPPKS
jgi:hypothetical protein